MGLFFLMVGSVLDHLEVEIFHRAFKAGKITGHGKSVRGYIEEQSSVQSRH
jgi:hypothetical protein